MTAVQITPHQAVVLNIATQVYFIVQNKLTQTGSLVPRHSGFFLFACNVNKLGAGERAWMGTRL